MCFLFLRYETSWQTFTLENDTTPTDRMDACILGTRRRNFDVEYSVEIWLRCQSRCFDVALSTFYRRQEVTFFDVETTSIVCRQISRRLN